MVDPRRLVVLIEGAEAGELEMTRTGRLHFSYATDRSPDSTPLSLSMPTTACHHEDRAVSAFVENVLPDNDDVLDRWRQEFGIRTRHPFHLLAAVGEDVAGAVQFVRPDRMSEVVGGKGSVEWLSEEEVAGWLRDIQADHTRWHLRPTGGQFSLPGAQSKIALFCEGGRWGRPSGALPTTHILKPAIPGYADHDINEHLCMATARRSGLPAARSAIAYFDGVRTLVVERYDRVKVEERWWRIHQEDLCQALAVPTGRKYQSQGGPGTKQIARLLWDAQQQPEALRLVREFVDQLAFHWLIAGTDAHAKNYSVLLSGPRVRLAPLYDAATALVYPGNDDLRYERLELAMAIGHQKRLRYVGERDWRRLALDVELPPDEVIDRISSIAERLLAALDDVCGSQAVVNLPGAMVERFHAAIAGNVGRAQRSLTARAGHELHKLDLGPRESAGDYANLGSAASSVTGAATAQPAPAPDRVWVEPYRREDGTSVRGHWRRLR